jgi:hypothetical protein
MTSSPLSPFNSLADNPLERREDVRAALETLFEPLTACFSAGGARVRIDASEAVFDTVAAEFEGFARPLWGLAAAAAGGIALDCWPRYRQGLTNGVDPLHPEYWGAIKDIDQRLVDLAAIAFAVRVAPAELWEPLDDATKANLRRYLIEARSREFSNNNWKFFLLIIDLALESVDAAQDTATHDEMLAEIDGFYEGDGWYRDGETEQRDHYIAFAFHFYGLLYARLGEGREARRMAFRDRAALFARDYRYWFDDSGGGLPIGRSLTYRFAMAAFWGALAFAGVEALPWGEIKGLYLRHLRWWAKTAIMRRDGLLTLGFAYPNANIVEDYSSAQSPYWALKAFLPLALPAEHPFWMAQELPQISSPDPVFQERPGLLIHQEPGNTVALSSGQANPAIRSGAEKYAKFAYSTRYGFSVESDLRAANRCTLDSMLALIDADGVSRVRERCDAAWFEEGILWSRWSPWRDVIVETALWWEGPWQMRQHVVETKRPLRSIEGGFAINRSKPIASLEPPNARVGVAAVSETDLSGVLAAGDSGLSSRLLVCQPNTNLLHPQTIVPQLLGKVAVGRSILSCAVLASPDLGRAQRDWESAPRF